MAIRRTLAEFSDDIATADIADNSITLAKMAGGTDGQIITYDASGDPVAVGPGTDGQVLTSTGAGSPPAFEALPASDNASALTSGTLATARMADGTVLQVVNNINNLSNGSTSMDDFLRSLRTLSNLKVTTEELGKIRHNHLQDIPIQLWGNIVDNYTDPKNHIEHNGWTLLNTATDLLWHKEKPTVASYGQNATIVDGLCRAVA